MVRLNQMRNAMGDDARFAAARSGQQQQRTFDVRNGIALLRIETFQKIHEMFLRRGRRFQNSTAPAASQR